MICGVHMESCYMGKDMPIKLRTKGLETHSARSTRDVFCEKNE